MISQRKPMHNGQEDKPYHLWVTHAAPIRQMGRKNDKSKATLIF